jgi:hypothetical protein
MPASPALFVCVCRRNPLGLAVSMSLLFPKGRIRFQVVHDEFAPGESRLTVMCGDTHPYNGLASF